MTKASLSFFLVLLLVFLTMDSFNSASRTFCAVEQSTLTCYFDVDLRETRKSFCLYRNNAQGEDTPLACNWKGNRPRCTAKSGFASPQNVSDEFAVTLPLDSPGTYYCDTIPPAAHTKKTTCHFDVTQESQQILPPEQGSPCRKPEQPCICADSCESENANPALITSTSVLAGLLCIILTAILAVPSGRYRVSSFACLRKGFESCRCLQKQTTAIQMVVVERNGEVDLVESHGLVESHCKEQCGASADCNSQGEEKSEDRSASVVLAVERESEKLMLNSKQLTQ